MVQIFLPYFLLLDLATIVSIDDNVDTFARKITASEPLFPASWTLFGLLFVMLVNRASKKCVHLLLPFPLFDFLRTRNPCLDTQLSRSHTDSDMFVLPSNAGGDHCKRKDR